MWWRAWKFPRLQFAYSIQKILIVRYHRNVTYTQKLRISFPWLHLHPFNLHMPLSGTVRVRMQIHPTQTPVLSLAMQFSQSLVHSFTLELGFSILVNILNPFLGRLSWARVKLPPP